MSSKVDIAEIIAEINAKCMTGNRFSCNSMSAHELSAKRFHCNGMSAHGVSFGGLDVNIKELHKILETILVS